MCIRDSLCTDDTLVNARSIELFDKQLHRPNMLFVEKVLLAAEFHALWVLTDFFDKAGEGIYICLLYTSSKCIVFCTGNQVILPLLFQFAVEAAESSNFDHQRTVIFRMLLRVDQDFAADYIKLYLETALFKVDRYGLRNLFNFLRTCLLYASRCV